MVCYKSSCISSGYIVTPFYFASRITPYMLSISWIVIPTSPHSHFGLSEMRIKSVTVHPNSSLGAQEPKNAMNSCLLHPIHHFSEVLWHFSHSNMFYTMKSVLASNADVHILSTIYKHVHILSIYVGEYRFPGYKNHTETFSICRRCEDMALRLTWSTRGVEIQLIGGVGNMCAGGGLLNFAPA